MRIHVSSKTSFILRAVLAIMLTIGFYGLALATIAGLVFLAYELEQHPIAMSCMVALAALLAAATIFFAILPRPDNFVPPGPRLEKEGQPRLFHLVDEVAQSMNQPMPAEIYLMPDVSASVSERGGIMGAGSKGVMGIGLSMLLSTTVSQTRAVLAHEFGHYYGGETKLTPRIYKAREAIIRTVQRLNEKSWLRSRLGVYGELFSLVSLPFERYGVFFLRITYAISRRQEFAADEQAVRIAGTQTTIEALRQTLGAEAAFDAFWNGEFLPILNSGFHPPMAEGFSQFLRARPVADALTRIPEEHIKIQKANPFDTHPSLRERIAALEALPVTDGGGDDTPAVSLLDDVPALEQALFEHFFGAAQMRQLKPIAWKDVAAQVNIPQWQKTAAYYAASLYGVTVDSLPEFLRSPEQLTHELRHSAAKQPIPEDILRGAVAEILRAAVCVALLRGGWELEDRAPGQQFSMRLGDASFEPKPSILSLVFDGITADDWRQECERLGIGGLRLAA